LSITIAFLHIELTLLACVCPPKSREVLSRESSFSGTASSL
jgi:hypothetical protein